MAKNDTSAPPAAQKTDFGANVHPICVDGKYLHPSDFKEVLAANGERWPNCAPVTCRDCELTFVSFGHGCPRCGKMNLKEL